jgi:hypothetical protein
MAIIFGTLVGLVPLTILMLVGFSVFTAIKKKDAQNPADQKPHALDVTYYIGMFVALVASVGSIIGILFAAIDARFKDVLDMTNYYNEIQVGDDVRISIAVLFVVFPIYLVLSWLQAKRIQQDSDRKNLSIRDFYIYSIVLVTALTIAGSFIYIIYNFLSGELLIRFIPKSLTLLVLAAFVLGYHIYLLRRDYNAVSKVPLGLSLASIVLVLSSVVYGVVQTGTPSEIRARKFDDKRLQDLSQIQSLILQKWQKDGVLPENLFTLNNEIGGTIIPVDPRTKAQYEYRVIEQSQVVDGPVDITSYPMPLYDKAMPEAATMSAGTAQAIARIGKVAKTDAKFELCATFETERDIAKRNGLDYAYKGGIEPRVMMESSYRLDVGYYTGDNSNPTWDHKPERTCYERTISVKQYQVYGN